MRRRVISAMMAAALAFSMTACGASGGDGGSSDSGSADASDGASGKADTISIYVYGNDQEQEIYKDMFSKFEEDNNCKIDAQFSTQEDYGTTITGMMTANELPDVFYMGPENVTQYVENGYIMDIDPVLKDNGLSTDDMMQNIVDIYRYDGSTQGQGDLYGLPHDGSVFAYAYNKDLFDKEGIEYPDPENPYTYDEFVEVCKKFTKDTDGDGEIDQWGCGAANAFMLYQYIWSNDASFLSDDYKTVTIDTPEFKDALQKYVDLTLTHKVTPTVEQDASLGVYQRWLAGQEAFYACGTWDVAAFMDDETFPFEWDLCAYPTLSSGVSKTWIGTVGYAVSAQTKNPDLATKLAYYMSADPEGNKVLSGISTGKSIQLPNITSLAENDFQKAIDDGTLPYPSNVKVFFNYMNGTDKYQGQFTEGTHTPNSGWLDEFFNNLDTVKNGSVTVDEYISQVQPTMQSLLDEAWESVE